MTTHIAIIGAGNVGRAHLEALMAIDRACVIQVVDPSLEALQKAEQLIKELPENPGVFEVTFSPNMRTLEDIIDMAIVSTHSNVRCGVIQQLCSTRQVRNILLEKPLFNKLEEYALAQSAIERHAVSVWVSCPRRIYPCYQHIKKRLKESCSVDMFVSGVSWGMSSNSIHFIDLFAHLTDSHEILWDTTGLSPNILPLTNEGFSEVNGALHGVTAKGDQLLLRSFDTGNAPTIIDIRTENFVAVIDETHKVAWMANVESGWDFTQEKLTVPYLNQLTHFVVQDILDESDCDYPSYDESLTLHLPWLRGMQQFIKRHRGEDTPELAIA